MKIKFKGEMSVVQLRQAIFEQLAELEEGYLVRHLKDISIYLTPTNGFGDEVYCRDVAGHDIQTLYCDGPYQSAADGYDL